MEQSNAHILMKINIKYKVILGLLITFLLLYFTNIYKLTNGKKLIIYNEDQNTETSIYAPDSKFELSFIHSVHHTPVYEVFEINKKNKIILTETKFYSLGVGMPYTEEGGTLINNNGEFILKYSREFDNLYLRVSPIPQHTIEINGEKYPLLEFAEEEQRINIYAKEKWMLVRR